MAGLVHICGKMPNSLIMGVLTAVGGASKGRHKGHTITASDCEQYIAHWQGPSDLFGSAYSQRLYTLWEYILSAIFPHLPVRLAALS
jgi:hypothetical protein